MVLTIAIVVATLSGYALGVFAGRSHWMHTGVRIGTEMVRSRARVVMPESEQRPVVELEAKLLTAQAELVRLEFKCAELAAQLKAQDREQDRWTNKPS